MNIFCQLIRSLPPIVEKWRTRVGTSPIQEQKLRPQLRDVLQAISYNPLVSLAFVPPQQQVFQEMSILYKSYTGIQQFLSQTLEDFSLMRWVRGIIYQSMQLEPISWLLTSFFNQFSIALWILFASLLPIRFRDDRYLRAEGV
jgi:hypothetical protein